MAGILLVEDEADLCNLIRTHLEAEGHTVHQAFDGPSALDLVESQAPDLIILDWMLPAMDGLTVCRRVRERHLTPILMLTARGQEADRVLGLEVGADDYVVKPFSMLELMARVRALLRRLALDGRAFATAGAQPRPGMPFALPAPPEAIVRGPLRVDPATHTASLDNTPLDLTPREFDLLLLFVAYPGRVFSRGFLLKHLWAHDYEGLDRTVDTHITRLRKKLDPFGDRIVTVWGVGYRFVA
ncbi:MAG TPA: response regulator transcription factor [Ktedonobacterales bacterium]|jgi:DNA-binding response OmpR family regulator